MRIKDLKELAKQLNVSFDTILKTDLKDKTTVDVVNLFVNELQDKITTIFPQLTDEDVDNVIQHIKPVVSDVIGQKYNVPYEEQLAFTQRAVNKFQNKSIIDTIYRNARQAKRKLGINERMLSPLRFTTEQGKDITWMEPVTAAAIVYAKIVEGEDITSVYDDLSTFLSKNELEKIKDLQNKFEENIPLSIILQTL